jgi:hypothetical protein
LGAGVEKGPGDAGSAWAGGINGGAVGEKAPIAKKTEADSSAIKSTPLEPTQASDQGH